MSRVEVTDSDLLAKLNKPSEEESDTSPKKVVVSDPDLLSVLNEGIPQPQQTTTAVEDPKEDLPDYAMEYTSPWEYLEGVAETVEAITRGATAGALGLAGDIESIGRLIFAGEDSQETLLPTSERVKQGVDYVFGEQKTNQLQPEGVQAAQFIGNIVAPATGVAKGVQKGSKFVADRVANSKAVKEALVDPIAKYSSQLANVKLNKQGDVVKDVVGQKLVDLDVNPQTVSYVTNTDSANKKAMLEILERTRKGVDNDVYRTANPATEVIGKSVVGRLNALKAKRVQFGKRLDEVVNSELKNQMFEVDGLNKSLSIAMRKAFDVDMGGISKLPEATQRNLKQLDRLINSQTDTGLLNGKDMHRLKKILDDLRDVGASENMSRAVDSVIGSVRKSVNNTLQESSGAYKAVNQKLSKVLDVESDFVRLDKTRQFKDDRALRAMVGAKFKSLGNSSTGLNAQWQESLRKLDGTLGELGVKFKDDPVVLSNFAVRANEFVNVNDATVLRYGSKEARRSAIKAVASGGIGNVFGAMNNTSNLLDIGISASNAKKAIKQHNQAYSLMVEALKKP